MREELSFLGPTDGPGGLRHAEPLERDDDDQRQQHCRYDTDNALKDGGLAVLSGRSS